MLTIGVQLRKITYPAVPMRTSWVLTLGKLPIRNAKTSIEMETVKDVQNRFIEIQRSRNTGISKMPTAKVALIACVAALNGLLGAEYLETGNWSFESSRRVEHLSLV